MRNLMKNMRDRALMSLAVLGAFGILLTGCAEEGIISKKNKVAFLATDAPVDNAEVEAVFVTVSEIKVDGQKVEGFQKTTVELSALTDGKTELLDETEFDATSINNIEIVLDYKADAQGNFPGSYVLKTDGSKEAIASSNTNITFDKSIDISNDEKTEVVLDFDLRKILTEKSEGDFELASENELKASIRVMNAANTGTVTGHVQNSNQINGKAIAYLYKEGTYSEMEMKAQGESNIQFANAVTSSVVSENGDFMIAFAEEGDYEIHIFQYDDVDQDGDLELTGKLNLLTAGGMDLNGFSIGASSATTINIDVRSVLTL